MSDPLFAAQRLEELFRYFAAASDASGLHKPDIDSEVVYDPSKAHISSDPILNGLCQLGVVRLGCDRGFVSLIDDAHQYIAAEVTSVGSLIDNSRHPPEETVCVGACILDLEAGVCAGTVPVFLKVEDPINTTNIFADESRYVINDFTKEERYSWRPYVTGYPYMRYYAEVPIKSTSGHVIGTYAVVDNKSRDGLSEEDYLILVDTASAIMRHFETLKVESDHNRALKLLRGLNNFVNTKELPPDWTPNYPPAQGPAETASIDIDGTRDPAEQHQTDHDRASISVTRPGKAISNPTKRNHTLVNDQQSSPTAKKPNDISARFSHAASILQDSMDLDGVVFLDASFNDYGSLYGSDWLDDALRDRGLDNTLSFGAHTDSSATYGRDADPAVGSLSPLLGSSIVRPTRPNSLYSLPPALQQSMIRDFPKGRVFNLNPSVSTTWINLAQYNEPVPGGQSTRKGSRWQKYSRLAILEEALSSYFPGAQSVVFVPFWDPYKSVWSTGGICWSTSWERQLTQEDVSYFSAFGNSAMMEIARLELAGDDKARSDFVSMMSHELRSPLHGILGGAELLKETEPSVSQRQMIHMVESCGHTLLQTLDQILHHSKINTRKPYMTGQASDKSVQQRVVAPAKPTTEVHLTAFTEDLIKSLVAGNQYRISLSSASTPEPQPQPARLSNQLESVITMVKFDKSADLSAEIDSATWQRVVLNLVGNALKYTASGQILARLSVSHVDDTKSNSHLVTFSVHDTGRGIAESYLREHLFTPFVQENAISDGVGLGLSIVKQLVDLEGGSIHVDSEVGKGTNVAVTLPLRKSTITPAPPIPRYAQLQVRIWDTSRAKTSSGPDRPVSASLVDSISETMEAWFGIRPTNFSEAEPTPADVLILTEADVRELRQSQSLEIGFGVTDCCIFLVLCTEHGILDRQSHILSDRIIYLTAPYGPHDMAAALQVAVDRNRTSEAALRIATTDFVSETPFKIKQRDDPQPLPIRNRRPPPPELEPSPASTDTDPVPPYQRPTVQPTETSNQPPPSSPPQQITAAETRRKTRVLLVDDNPVNLKILEHSVRSLGHDYDCASNGQEAVTAFRAANTPAAIINGTVAAPSTTQPEPYTHIFMDISMPIMDGFEASRAIRELEKKASGSPCQIIAMTGLGSEDAQDKALRSGMDKFFRKPVQIKTIRAQLK